MLKNILEKFDEDYWKMFQKLVENYFNFEEISASFQTF